MLSAACFWDRFCMKHACWLEGLRNKFRCDHVVWRYLYLKIVIDYNDTILYWGSIMTFESESCSVVSDSLQPRGLHSPRNTPGQNTRVGSFSLLQGIFPTQGSNPGLPHYMRIPYQLSHQGSWPWLITNWIKHVRSRHLWFQLPALQSSKLSPTAGGTGS